MLAVALPLATALALAAPPPDDPEAAFEDLTGAELVWSRDELPEVVLFDRTPPLPADRRRAAAALLLEEARKYPPRFFARVGLTTIGVFAACVSDEGDGFRPYDEALGGYRYFGQWAPEDGRGALIAAFYSAGQLPQTFHHEVFHHVDATRLGKVDYAHFTADDARFAEAVQGTRRYRGPSLAADIVKELSELDGGDRLAGDNGDYSKKSAGEDQAEAARWLMTHLPDALLQVAHEPELPGSQRLLHLIRQYAGATRVGAPADLAWFVGVALGRDALGRDEASANAEDDDEGAGDDTPEALRRWLDAEARLAARGRSSARADAVARATVQLTRQRIRPEAGDTRFTVWTPPAFQGGANPVLQADVRQIALDAARLRAWRGASAAEVRVLRRAQDELLALLDAYRTFIATRWGLSQTTARTFDAARRDLVAALLGEAAAPARSRDNPHLEKVDEAIADEAWRHLIRGVQPAAVKVGNGSGVNLSASGLVLTNAHVAEAVGDVLDVTFPDGARWRGTTIASDHHADLALVRLDGASDLPVAPVARRAPRAGDAVAAIGQPGRFTPSGEATGYEGWHVSVGRIRGFLDDLYGDQSLGRTKHDAWTYWGHSGSPLFDHQGAIAALHNSWDSKTAMRHAVPHQVIVRFLDAQGVAYSTR